MTIEGDVSLVGENGIVSHGELNIFGYEASYLYASGRFEAIYVTDDLTVKGGTFDFGTASYPSELSNPKKYHLYAMLAEGDGVTVTFEGAKVKAANNDYGEAQPYFKEDVEYGNIAAGGIKAPKLVLKNTVIKVETGNVHYKEGLTPKAIGIDANELNVSDSTLEVKAGNCYESIGIRCTGIADFINSEVTAKSGTSDHISVGVDFNMMDVTDSTVYANGGEAKRYSAGLVGGMLNADGSQVKGYGGVATDTNVVDEEGVFSEGIFVETIYGTDSEIYGEGEKAMISNGIAATEISINGGVIYGIGSEESEDSIGIHLEPSEMDDGTPIPVKFELVGGDVVARGGTQGLLADTEDFAGVSYKADEIAE